MPKSPSSFRKTQQIVELLQSSGRVQLNSYLYTAFSRGLLLFFFTDNKAPTSRRVGSTARSDCLSELIVQNDTGDFFLLLVTPNSMLLQCSMLNTALHIAASYSGYLQYVVPRTHWKPHLLRINPVNSICPFFISQLLSMGSLPEGSPG